MPKDYVAAYERIAREEHREHGLVELGRWDTEPVEALVAEIEADPALAEDREACRARVRALRDLYHGDRAFPSDCPSGRRLAAAARSYLGRWPYDREVQDIHDLVMTLSWRYGEAYDYYRELRKDPRARLYAVWRIRNLADDLYHEGLIGTRERMRLYDGARRAGVSPDPSWMPPDVLPYG